MTIHDCPAKFFAQVAYLDDAAGGILEITLGSVMNGQTD